MPVNITPEAKCYPGFSICGFSFPKRAGTENQDHGYAVVANGRLMVVVTDGVTRALMGGSAGIQAAKHAVDAFLKGEIYSQELLKGACHHLYELNLQEAADFPHMSQAFPYQCMCVIAVIEPDGCFEWAALGDSSIELSNAVGESEILTHDTEIEAARSGARVGIEPAVLHFQGGDGIIPAGAWLRLYTDGFGEVMDGQALPELERALRGEPLNDDTTVIEIRRN